MLPAYLRHMKKYHLAHHYKNFELGFGVTSTYTWQVDVLFLISFVGKIWDYAFNTLLVV